MDFYNDKLVFHRKQSHMSSGRIAGVMGISRTTYWKWEKGISSPNKKQTRTLAKILEISVSDFSNLDPLPNVDIAKSSGLSGNIDSWSSFFDIREKKSFQKTITETLNASIKLSNKLSEAGIIIEALLTGISSIFYVKNNELLYLTANDGFLKNISLKPSFVVFGKTDDDFFSRKEAKENCSKDEQVLITKEKSVEEGYIPGSKHRKWGIISRIPIFDLNNNIAGLITNIVDITQRKKAEYDNGLLRTCIENMSEAVLVFNHTAEKTVYANKSASEITGYSLKEIYSRNNTLELDILVSAEEREKSLQYRKDESWPKIRKLQVKCKNGTLKWVQIYHSNLIDFMKDRYLIGVTTDITDTITNENQSSVLHALLDSANVGVRLRNDSKDNVIFVNKAFETIYGYPIKNFVENLNFRINTCVHPADIKLETHYFETKKYPKLREYRILRPNGELRWLKEVSFNTDCDGEKYSGCICRDITEEKKSGLLNPYKVAKILKSRNVDQKIISEVSGLSENTIEKFDSQYFQY
ncbi:MAG TPA: PAS domain S-box protein [Victivallales bacterium]|nr:PAS domain S-box protein [Victivallales bacterium]